MDEFYFGIVSLTMMNELRSLWMKSETLLLKIHTWTMNEIALLTILLESWLKIFINFLFATYVRVKGCHFAF